MMLTTKARYAVMSMVDIASDLSSAPVNLQQISARQNISLSYLEQIFAKLRQNQLVTSVRGPGGGYALSRERSQIMIAEIVAAVDEPIKMTRCKNSNHGCMTDKTVCLTHDLWAGLGSQILGYLSSVSLDDVCQKRLKKL
jgi:Rrf2 family iron-sulfur cluster assembly transcriptional regulator